MPTVTMATVVRVGEEVIPSVGVEGELWSVESGSENENGEDTLAAVNESEVLDDGCKILYN